MFGSLKNECIIKFHLSAKSPISIRSGENLELDPTLPDNQFIRSYHNGKDDVVIPGSSIKGVFRSRTEKLLNGSCDIFDRNNRCSNKIRKADPIKDKYIKSCPACRMYGNIFLKSRVEFKDAFPIDGTVKLATRHNVGIDRVTGASNHGALFEPEVLEQGTFEVEITMKNFFLWQLKVILQIFEDINEGYATFGGVTSRGFGKMSVDNVDICVREYGRGKPEEFYAQKHFSPDEIIDKVKNVPLSPKEFEKVDFNEPII